MFDNIICLCDAFKAFNKYLKANLSFWQNLYANSHTHTCTHTHSHMYVGWILTSNFQFYWLQGVLIAHNASARVIRSNQSLVLQKITRNSTGNYSCSAINAEGETVSNQLPLRVKCKYFKVKTSLPTRHIIILLLLLKIHFKILSTSNNRE